MTKRPAAEVRAMEHRLNRSPEVKDAGLRVRLEAVDEPTVRLSRERTDHDRAEHRALGRSLAREHLAEDARCHWQGLPEDVQLSEAEQEAVEIGLETAKSWGAQVN